MFLFLFSYFKITPNAQPMIVESVNASGWFVRVKLNWIV